MIAHVAIMVTIGFIIEKENKEAKEVSDIQVNESGAFMIACGLLLPLFSFGLFIAVNSFWIKSYFIDIFECVCKEGKGLSETVQKMQQGQPQLRTWRVTQLYDKIKHHSQYTADSGFSFKEKYRFALFCTLLRTGDSVCPFDNSI
eukprot:m.110348 g.110348  ORF g.110348 m.110348 type:complete len:145 (+) comp37388_c0_seq4:2228-2662(+)